MKKIIFILLSFIFLQLSCSLPRLGIEKKEIKPGILKTNGFYYEKSEYVSYMFYNNGVVLGGFGHSDAYKSVDTIKKEFTDSNFYKSFHKVPYAWGLFKIAGDSIKIEKWESREWAAYGVSKYSGIILNDTTFALNNLRMGRDTFYFHYLAFKPDSTNKYIK